MSSQPIEHLHPVLDFAQRLVSRLDSLADAPLMSMRPEDKRAALVTLAQGSSPARGARAAAARRRRTV